MGEAGRKRFEQQFTSDKFEQNFIRIMQKILLD
jgi:hypothetical protein